MRRVSLPWRLSGLVLTGVVASFLACGGGGAASGNNVGPTPPPPDPPTPPPAPAPAIALYVAPSGSASAAGTQKEPTSLDHAMDLVAAFLKGQAQATPSERKTGKVLVQLQAGRYERSTTLLLTSNHSGTTDNPVEIAGDTGQTVRITGASTLPTSGFKPLQDTDPNATRIPSGARSQVLVADLSAYAGRLGSLASRVLNQGNRNQAAELFVDGAAMTLARTPNAVAPDTIQTLPRQTTLRVSGTLSPDVTGDFTYRGDDSLGRPYYQQVKGGQTWTISTSSDRPLWEITNRFNSSDPSNLVRWRAPWGIAAPYGAFDAEVRATGSAFIQDLNQAEFIPGWTTILGSDGSQVIQHGNASLQGLHADEVMAHGFFYHSWASYHAELSSITGSEIRLKAAPNYGIRAGQPFFLYNVLEGLDLPGEYFIDRTLNRLYVIPPAGSTPSEYSLSMLQQDLVKLDKANGITWRNIVFEGARDGLVETLNTSQVQFLDCTFRNAGGKGLELTGSSNLVDHCAFYGLGKGGVQACGGNRFTLTASGTCIQNSEFHHSARLFWTYTPAISIQSTSSDWQEDCVGITVQQNSIHDLPHQAIYFTGNNHLIRWNSIHHVCLWTNDAGAIYTGRDWASRGTVISQNLFQSNGGPMGTSVASIYLDDTASGTTIEANVFYYSTPAYAIWNGGGRDNLIRYNMFEGHWHAVVADNRGAVWAPFSDTPGDSWNMLERMRYFNYQSDPWAKQYPSLAQVPPSLAAWKQDPHWLQPEGCILLGNVHSGKFPKLVRDETALAWYGQVQSNIADQAPGFIDPAKGNFGLRTDSPMLKLPGFPGLNASKIGVH